MPAIEISAGCKKRRGRTRESGREGRIGTRVEGICQERGGEEGGGRVDIEREGVTRSYMGTDKCPTVKHSTLCNGATTQPCI